LRNDGNGRNACRASNDGLCQHTDRRAGKKIQLSACAMPCAAVPGETIAHVEPIAFVPLSPWTVAHTGLFGLTSAPATPPPQIV